MLGYIVGCTLSMTVLPLYAAVPMYVAIVPLVRGTLDAYYWAERELLWYRVSHLPGYEDLLEKGTNHADASSSPSRPPLSGGTRWGTQASSSGRATSGE